MAAEMLVVYANSLAPYSDSSIDRVTRRLAMRPREEFEPKVPELGTMVDLVKREFWAENPWKPCGNCSNGHVTVFRDGERFAERCNCWKEWKRRSEQAAARALLGNGTRN